MTADTGSRGGWQAWIPIGVHALSVQAVGFSLRPAVAYAALDAGVAPALLGALSASYALAPLMLALPVGRAVDRFGERPPLITGGVLMAAACVVLLTESAHAGWLIVGLMLAGVSHLFCVIGEQTAVAKMPAGSSDSRFGTYTLVSSSGQAIGPLFLGFGDGAPFNPTPVLIMALTLSGLILVSSFFIGDRLARDAERRDGATVTLLRDRRIRTAILVSGIVMAAVDITLIYLPALGREVGLSAAFVGWVLALRAVSSMAVRGVTGRAVRRFGRRVVLVTGTGAAAAALVALSVWPQPAVLLIAAAILGAGLGVGQPVTMATVADLAPAGQRGTAMTLRLMGNRLGVVVLPVTVGAVAAGAGAVGVLASTAALLCAAATASARQ